MQTAFLDIGPRYWFSLNQFNIPHPLWERWGSTNAAGGQMDWRLCQCFGDKTAVEEITDGT